MLLALWLHDVDDDADYDDDDDDVLLLPHGLLHRTNTYAPPPPLTHTHTQLERFSSIFFVSFFFHQF